MYRVVLVPDSVVYHYGGFSLKADSFKKASYNHRNQMVMLLKNLSLWRLCWVFPLRIVLELASVLLLFKGNWKHPFAALFGISWVLLHPVNIYKRRLDTQRRRRVSDAEMAGRFYPKSVVYWYFAKGVRSVQQLSL
jgi:GT2 family glycosyltransferase